MADKPQENLTFGFDIGIASVGWCVLEENRIVDLGVRCFDKAETPDKGESLNKARRDARLMRRRLRRRAWRLTKLARLLKRTGLLVDLRAPATVSPWTLRVEGLDRRLDDEEWARVIYHLCKHRGFHWISRAEEKAADEDNTEGRPVKKGLADTRMRMMEKHYRSTAEMVLAEFPDAQRNKQGAYGKALSRELLADELALLFERQRTLGNPHAAEALQAKVSELFWSQKPPLTGDKMLEMLGHCTFEKAEFRAPKASFTAERHVWLTRLNNLRIVVDGVTRRLNDEERRIALPLPYAKKTNFTFKNLHDALVKAGLLPASFTFAGLRASKEDKDPLAQTLVKIPAWQELRKTLEKAGLETEWQGMAGAAMDGRPELLDDIAWVLSIYKTDDEAAAKLRKLPLPNADKMIEALLGFPRTAFKAFHALSLKALRKIVPPMETGLRYDDACQHAGYHHSQPNSPEDEDKGKTLPSFYEHVRGKGLGQAGRMIFSEKVDQEITGGIPRNPVVLRALNQARKVMNALIKEYGSPAAVHIELARDLTKPLNGHPTRNGDYLMGRRDIEKEQKAFQERNLAVREKFIGTFKFDPKGREFEKYQLYEEQGGKCAYSGASLDIHRVVHEIGYAEVDHALPWSRSFDDSKNNKVLVLKEENQNKGNRTPYEYLTSFEGGEQGERWRRFVAYVEATYSGKTRLAKKSRLLRKNFGQEEASEFKARNLNDTRYICKFFKNYVERYLQLAPIVGAGGTAEKTAERCVVLSGQLTAFLRARWGLTKVREANDRHHAIDAAVVAACSHGMVKRLSDYSRRHELENVRSGYVDAETGVIANVEALRRLERHFPEPWPHFRFELCSRLNIDDPAELREAVTDLGTYPAEAIETLRPLFVSRAPQRRNSGAAHKDTIYSQPEKLKPTKQVVQHIDLESLSRNHFGFLEDYFAERKRLATDSLTRKAAAKLFTAYADPKAEIWSAEGKWRECQLLDPERNKEFYEALYDHLAKHEWNGKKAFSDGYRKPTRRKNAAISPPVRKVAVIISSSGIPVRGGIAKNDTMLRVDVFRHKKDGKFHLVPVYVHHAVTKELPNRAIVQGREEDRWPIMEESHDFQFSLYPNDLTRVTLKDDTRFGYYASCDRSTGAISLWAHDRNQQAGKDGLIRSIGVKTAVALEKFHVDVLGNIYPAPKEERRGLA